MSYHLFSTASPLTLVVAACFCGRLLPAAASAQSVTNLKVQNIWRAGIYLDGGIGTESSGHTVSGNLVTNIGGSAEAGAMVQLSKRQSLDESAQARLKALGLRDGARFGDRGRWYLFAAASGHAVGLNMLHTGSSWQDGSAARCHRFASSISAARPATRCRRRC